MKRILLISNYFSPDNAVAAIRLTKFAKYLKESGYYICVIAEKKDEAVTDSILQRDASGIKIIYAHNSPKVLRLLKIYRGAIKKTKQKRYENLDDRFRFNKCSGQYEFFPFETAHPVIGSLDYMIDWIRQYDLFLSVKNRLKKMTSFDICFSSYGDFFSIFSGLYYKHCHSDKKWILDIRDPICRYKFTPDYVWPLAGKVEKKSISTADTVIAVSKQMCKMYGLKYKKKIYCITNGYDRNDRIGLISSERVDRKFTFTYTGAMYGGLQNLSILFLAIDRLSKQKKIDINQIVFSFAGKSSAYEIFFRQASAFGLGKNCVYHGRISREESLCLQLESHILLVSSWDFRAGYAGVITGKLLEYMSAGKPVLAIINGDISNHELTRIVKECNLGFSYEQANKKRDFPLLMNFLEQKYREFEKNGKLLFHPDQDYIKQYDYKSLTNKLINLIEHV